MDRCAGRRRTADRWSTDRGLGGPGMSSHETGSGRDRLPALPAAMVLAGMMLVSGPAAGQGGISDFMRSAFPGSTAEPDATPPAQNPPAAAPPAAVPTAPEGQPAFPGSSVLRRPPAVLRPAVTAGGIQTRTPSPDGVVVSGRALPTDPAPADLAPADLAPTNAAAHPVALFPDTPVDAGPGPTDAAAALDAARDGDGSIDETIIRSSLRRHAPAAPPAATEDPGPVRDAAADAPAPRAAAKAPAAKPVPKKAAKPAGKRKRDDGEFADWDRELEKAVGEVSFVDDNGDQFDGRETADGTFVGVIDYRDGGRYEGEAVDGKRHGRGTMTYANGGRYTGAWRHDKWHGEGVGIAENGNRYEGTYRNHQKHGTGVYVWSEGDRYQGGFVDGLPEGDGVKLFANGDRYDGGWKAGMRDGEGRMVYANGDRYAGTWRQDKYHGTGRYRWAAGHQYDGDWETGQRHGSGRFEFKDGKVYEGAWRFDYRHGRGTETLPDGTRWEGSWYYDEPRGRLPQRNQAAAGKKQQ